METVILLTEHQAAEILTVKTKTLQAWRVRGGGPKFIKVGACVRYTPDALKEFLATHTVTHTRPRGVAREEAVVTP